MNARLRDHLIGTQRTAEHVRQMLEGLLRFCEGEKSKNHVHGLLDAMKQIVGALEPATLAHIEGRIREQAGRETRVSDADLAMETKRD